MLDVIYSVAVVVFLLAITYKIARDPDWYEKSKQHQCSVFPAMLFGRTKEQRQLDDVARFERELQTHDQSSVTKHHPMILHSKGDAEGAR